MSKLSREEKEKISNYTYDEAVHALFAIDGQIIDYKLEIAAKVERLKALKKGKEDEQINNIKNLAIQIEKLKTTYIALKTNDEMTYFERIKNRKEIKEQLKVLKLKHKVAKKFAVAKDYENYIDTHADLTKIDVEIATIDNISEITKINAEISALKQTLKKYKKENNELRRALKIQKIKTARYSRLAEEKKAILTLDKVKDKEKIDELEQEYHNKKGKVLKYQANSLSYWLMLLVVLLEVIYIIVFLNSMYVSYMEFPVLIINLIFTLFLFLSAMKVKVYNKTWTIINFIFSIYLIIRIFVVVPFVAVDHEALLDESGQIVQAAISYADLRTKLYVLSGIMLGLVLLANVRSYLKIRERNLHLD